MATNSNAKEIIQAYKLNNEFVYPKSDFDYEAELIEFPKWDETASGFWAPQEVTVSGCEGLVTQKQQADGKWRTVEFKLPEKIEFETVGDIIHHTDYPYCKPQWPIMSKRMLETLLAVRPFPHQTVPVTMIDIQMYYDEAVGDYVAPEKRFDNFVAVQLLEHIDIIDWENTIYSMMSDLPDIIGRVDRLVFNEPKNGFPPLFRVATPEFSVPLYVSPEGRAALEAAGIQGVRFIESLYSG